MPLTRERTERPREPLLQPGLVDRVSMCRIGGRLRVRHASVGGADVEIPPLLSWFANVHKSSARTWSGGQFDWGGRLRKSNGGLPRFPQAGW